MSAGFKVGDEVFWGTNGAIEAYVGALASHAASQIGPNTSLVVFLEGERDGFASGKIVYLDEWLVNAAGRRQFLRVLDAATDDLLRAETFTEYGREWVTTIVAELRTRIADGH